MASPQPIEVSVEAVRRLAVLKQRLSGRRPPPTLAGMQEVARDMRVIQIDPIAVVDRTQNLVLWSRLGTHDRTLLDRLWWESKFLFSYWAHAASLVLTEDLPLHRHRMKRIERSDDGWARRQRNWMETNGRLKNKILRELRRRGPLRVRDIEDVSDEGWRSSGWTSERNVARMFDLLWIRGKVVIAGREGVDRVWDLTDRWLPEWAPKGAMRERQVTEAAAQVALKALGIASTQQIRSHFIPGGFAGLPDVLKSLERHGYIHPVRVLDRGEPLKGRWFVHADDVPLLETSSSAGTRTTLLSPFDNMIRDRNRTEQLWGFHYRIEIYVPKDLRRFGYYSMPILHGDRLVGRVDPKSDRARGVLRVNSVHFEDGVAPDADLAEGVLAALQDLARFTVSGDVEFAPRSIPRGWKKLLSG